MADEPEAVKQDEGALVGNGAEAEVNAPGGTAQRKPSDEEVVKKLKEVLETVSLDVTERQLRTQLEEFFGAPLKDRKELIRSQVVEWLSRGQGGDEEEADEEEEEEEEEEEQPTGRKNKRKGGGGGGGGGFNVECKLSPQLAAFMGVETMSRSQVVKKMWEYIKEHDLQDPSNRRKILPDAKLRTIFTPPLDMFSMNKQLSNHIYTDDDPDAPPRPKRPKVDGAEAKKRKKAKKEADPDAPPRKSGFTKELKCSQELADWLGQPSISRGGLTKFFWAYIKDKGLLNPENKKEVISDARLRSLTGEQRFQAFGYAKYFTKHLQGYVDD